MKLQILLLFILINFISFSQKFDFSINKKLGIATRNLYINHNKSIPEVNKFYNKPINKNDFGLEFRFKYKILKKLNVYINSGASYSKSEYYFRLINLNGNYFGNIPIVKDRLEFHVLGLNKEFNLYDNKILLDIGFSWIERYFFSKKDYIYTPFYELKQPELYPKVRYYYGFETNYNTLFFNTDGIKSNYLKHNSAFYTHLKIRLTKSVFLNFGLSYSRNYIFFYNYNLHFLYFSNNEAKGQYFQWNHNGFVNIKDNERFGVREHFIYFNFGVSFKFNRIIIE